jgi:hypothetical protein
MRCLKGKLSARLSNRAAGYSAPNRAGRPRQNQPSARIPIPSFRFSSIPYFPEDFLAMTKRWLDPGEVSSSTIRDQITANPAARTKPRFVSAS